MTTSPERRSDVLVFVVTDAHTGEMSTTVYPAFRTSDHDATIAMLLALGFEEKLVVRDRTDPHLVVHAQFDHGSGGGVMFSDVQEDGRALNSTGGNGFYVVVDTDDEVDRMAVVIASLGLPIDMPPTDREHGGREFDFRDHDGNFWGVGSYPGAE